MTDIKLQIQEALRKANNINPTELLLHITYLDSKRLKPEKILKVVGRGEHLAYKGTRIKITADISSENMRARKKWSEVLKERIPSNLEIYVQQNYTLKGKEIS